MRVSLSAVKLLAWDHDGRPILLDRPDGFECRLTATDFTALIAFTIPRIRSASRCPPSPEEREEPLAAAVQSLACLTASGDSVRGGRKRLLMTDGGITSSDGIELDAFSHLLSISSLKASTPC